MLQYLPNKNSSFLSARFTILCFEYICILCLESYDKRCMYKKWEISDNFQMSGFNIARSSCREIQSVDKTPNTSHFFLSKAQLSPDHNKINITTSLGCQDYMAKKLLDLVNPNGSLSLSIFMFAGLYFFKMETDLMSQY